MLQRSVWKWSGMAIGSCLLLFGQTVDAVIASGRAMGMGQVAVAYPQDSLTTVYNPASTVHIGDRFDLGVDYRQWRKELTLKDRPIGAENGTFRSKFSGFLFPEIGFNKSLGCDWAVGLAFYNYDRIYTNYGRVMTDFGDGGSTNLRYDYMVEAAKATLGWKVNHSHSIGLSVDLYGSRFKVDGIDAFAALTRLPGQFENNGYDYSTGVGFTVGWIGHFQDCLCNDCVTLGVSFSPKVFMRKLDRYEGFFPNHGIDIPAILRAGFSYQCSPKWLLASDFEYRWYSDIKHYANHFPSSGTLFPNLFGGDGGPGLGWKDQWIAKVGLEYEISHCLTARAGYRFEHVPYRNHSEATFLNALTVKAVEHIVSLGTTWRLDPCSEVTLYGEYGLNNRENSAIPSITLEEPLLLPGNEIFAERYFTIGLSFGRKF